MKLVRFVLVAEVDDEVLARHPGDAEPPPNNLADWYDTDLFEAWRLGLVVLCHADLESVEILGDTIIVAAIEHVPPDPYHRPPHDEGERDG